jgi:hypothetical protein
VNAGDSRAKYDHRLMPHEKLIAHWMLGQQDLHPTPYVQRMRRDFGPEGVVLYAAATADLFLCIVLALASAVIAVVSALIIKSPQFPVSDLYVFGGLLLSGLAGTIRIWQGVRISRAFRTSSGPAENGRLPQ